MPESIEERWSVRVRVKSDLQYIEGTGPRTNEEVRERGLQFSQRITRVLSETFPEAELRVRVLEAFHSSAHIEHEAGLSFGSPSSWLECRKIINDLMDDFQEIFEQEWLLQEGAIVSSVGVQTSVIGGALPPQSRAAVAATNAQHLRPDFVMRAIRLREKMIWTFLFVGMFVGAAFATAATLYVELRRDVDDLRGAQTTAGVTPPSLVVTTYPPNSRPVVLETREQPCLDCPVIRRVP